jgi:hypothetical protein
VSFFDEAEEPRTAPTVPRRRRSSGSGGRPPNGRGPGTSRRPPGGRRPPTDRQAIQVRRAVAAVVVVVLVVLAAVGIHSCQVSQRNSSLKDYNNSVSSLIQNSDQTGRQFFNVLSGGGSSGNAVNLQNQINEAHLTAANQLNQAKAFNVPGEVNGAQQNLLLALQMRLDGIAAIGREIQQALNGSTSKDAINSIAADMARFYSSDVLYKNYTLPLIAGALKGAGIAIGGNNGATFNDGQFLPDIRWLTPSYIATQLHVSLPPPSGKIAPGTHGHQLNSVSVGGTTLQTGSTNTIPASPPATFTLNFTNTGTNTENNVVCKVTVSNSNVSGQTVVPQTTPGQQVTCQVQLGSSPPAGNSTVTATVVPVPGEKHIANNTMTFPVSFQ